MKKCIICKIAALLAGIGALNWLLVALFNFNLVATVAGDMTTLAKVIYVVVGIAGALVIYSVFGKCPGCKTG